MDTGWMYHSTRANDQMVKTGELARRALDSALDMAYTERHSVVLSLYDTEQIIQKNEWINDDSLSIYCDLTIVSHRRVLTKKISRLQPMQCFNHSITVYF
jgi:hypothetical protein